jgi:hypothetical protein
VTGRRAADEEIERWREDGFVVLTGLVGTEIIDAAVTDLWNVFPRPERFHADPVRCIRAGRDTASLRHGYPTMPEHGPAFRPEQHRWGHEFPFIGSNALNRLFVHPAIVDVARRTLDTDEVRIYQAHVSGRYTGDADYEQPMHTDRNHSLVPAVPGPPFHQVQLFVYLTDVDDDCAPTHVTPLASTRGRSTNEMFFPDAAPELFGAEQATPGPRGTVLVYRNEVFHRGVDITAPGGSRFLAGVSFKRAGTEWVTYHSFGPKATHPGWVQFVASATPEELALFGFPAPGDPVWTDALLDATAVRYPGLDLSPWRRMSTSH